MWTATAFCIFNLCFYAWDYWKQSTGWEEVYVCVVEGKWVSEVGWVCVVEGEWGGVGGGLGVRGGG